LARAALAPQPRAASRPGTGRLPLSGLRGRGRSEVALHVHHVRPFAAFEHWREANQLDNLLTLCRGCHTRRETQERHANVKASR